MIDMDGSEWIPLSSSSSSSFSPFPLPPLSPPQWQMH